MSDITFGQIGRYRIVSELGRGAMGIVYGAEDHLLSRRVAIKTILLSEDAEERAEYEPRFYQEAKAAGSLNHPNIITIYDIGREGEMAYIAMELLEGEELRSLMLNGRLTLRRALGIAAQVAEGIAFAHERGVIHRDIKPGNVMVLRGDIAKIMDFGIARLRTSDVKTATGMLLGSPKYMSPEQIVGSALDHRSDIFSLGVVIYEMAVGNAPFDGPDLPSLMFAIGMSDPVPPSRANPALPKLLDLILAKALAKKADARYQDARELAADLRACRDALPPDPPPPEHEKTQRLSAGGGPDATRPDGKVATQILTPMLNTGERALADTVPLEQADAATPLAAAPAPGRDSNTSGGTPRYAVSPRFDSSATLMKLKTPAGTKSRGQESAAQDNSAAGSKGSNKGSARSIPVSRTARRPRYSPERLFVAAAIVVALIAAVVIALV